MAKFCTTVLMMFALASFLSAEGTEERGLFGTIRGSGDLVTRRLEISDFTEISAGWGMRLEVRRDSRYRVELRADDNIIDEIKYERTGDRLRFYLPAGTNLSGATIEIGIAAPELERLELSGGARAMIDGFESGRDGFSAELSGGSKLAGRLEAEFVELSCSGGSTVELEGEAEELEIEGSGGAVFMLYGFPVEDASVSLSGGSRAELAVRDRLSVSASGGSTVYYAGDPEIRRTDLSGGSSIRRR
jgi:hypothetical protein